ncbi:hypothetical protein HUJ04_008258 [Dendroctonus ponderosae]|nr:hypothetical protein HUJ04_008258 [Dendroctonus ponderosae]KAH1008122.1 hypothetical protein HUJ05_008705 [Dendroctonus ponderosae]
MNGVSVDSLCLLEYALIQCSATCESDHQKTGHNSDKDSLTKLHNWAPSSILTIYTVMTDMRALIRKRGIVKHKITNFIKYFDPVYVKFVAEEQLEAKYIIELQIRLTKLEQSVKNQVEIDCPLDQVEIQSQERNIFENNYYCLVAKAKQIFKKYENNDSVISANSRVSNRNYSTPESFYLQEIKLPPTKCATFNCEFSKWLEFKDTFEALFHSNVGLSDIQKFHYLRSCLGDESLKSIQSLDFAAQNYNNVFDNSQLLVNHHVKSFEIQTLSKESSSHLRQIIDTINEHLRAFKTLQLPTEHWDAILIYMVSLK